MRQKPWRYVAAAAVLFTVCGGCGVLLGRDPLGSNSKLVAAILGAIGLLLALLLVLGTIPAAPISASRSG